MGRYIFVGDIENKLYGSPVARFQRMSSLREIQTTNVITTNFTESFEGTYFDLRYPRHFFRETNTYVGEHPMQYLQRRSQRSFHLPDVVSYYERLWRFGLVRL